MIRDPKTPLLLWIAVIGIAVRAHMFAADGGDFIALVHNDHKALAELGAQARERVRQREQTFDVEGLGLGPKSAEETIQPPPPPPKPPEPKKDPKKEEKPKTPEEKKKAEEEKKKLPLLVKKEEKTPPPQPQPMQPDKRIAVRQHAKANQADNPNAKFIGDEANHVDQETVATQTSHDQDDPNPTPGGNHAGPQDKVGDSERTKIAESEEHAGDKNRAPGEKGTEFDVQPVAKPLGPMAMLDPRTPQPGGDGRPAAAPSRDNPAPAQMPPAANPSGADVQDANNGGWTFNPIRPGAPSGFAPSPAGPANNTAQGRAASGPALLGLGGRAAPGQINLNLTHQGIVAIVGQDQLRKERQADGERRKSEHRGSWTASNFERWRSAIENYVSSVKPGNQTALNTAAVPFATYLNGMHNRIHPLFADSFLNSLDNLPATHPLNDIKLMTRLEIVLTRDGHLVKMGIVKTSGVTAFDIAALDAVQRASPFSAAPGAIVSPDGKVYLHWEFHRDEVYACSTMNARPFMLNTPPAQPPADPLPPPSTPVDPSRERGVPSNTRDVREGRRVRPATARSS